MLDPWVSLLDIVKLFSELEEGNAERLNTFLAENDRRVISDRRSYLAFTHDVERRDSYGKTSYRDRQPEEGGDARQVLVVVDKVCPAMNYWEILIPLKTRVTVLAWNENVLTVTTEEETLDVPVERFAVLKKKKPKRMEFVPEEELEQLYECLAGRAEITVEEDRSAKSPKDFEGTIWYGKYPFEVDQKKSGLTHCYNIGLDEWYWGLGVTSFDREDLDLDEDGCPDDGPTFETFFEIPGCASWMEFKKAKIKLSEDEAEDNSNVYIGWHLSVSQQKLTLKKLNPRSVQVDGSWKTYEYDDPAAKMKLASPIPFRGLKVVLENHPDKEHQPAALKLAEQHLASTYDLSLFEDPEISGAVVMFSLKSENEN